VNDLVKSYFEQAKYDPGDERKIDLAATIAFMVKRKMISDLTYRRFVGLMYQLEKAVYV